MGQMFLVENESHIYPNMCAKFGCGPTVVSKKSGGYRRTDRQRKLQLYIMYSMIMYSRSVKFSGITSPIRPPTLRNITSSNVER